MTKYNLPVISADADRQRGGHTMPLRPGDENLMISASRLTDRTVLILSIVAACAVHCVAQEADAERKDASTQEQTQFASGVVTVIPPSVDPKETFDGPLSLQTFLDAHPEIEWSAPNFPEKAPHFDPRTRTLVEMAKQVTLRREVYCLEFSFKPLRQIYIDVPRPDGRLQRKLIWYMVYRVRYRGGDMRPVAERVGDAPIYRRIESVSYQSRRFFPMLVLSNHVTGKHYLDTILPSAKSLIAVREQISAPLHNSVDVEWGIATWVDVDPTLDFVSVNVTGVTNAFQQDGEGDSAPYRRKALQLNFYRPGDSVLQTEDKIRFGVPAFEDKQQQEYILKQYGLTERLDYQWIFRSIN